MTEEERNITVEVIHRLEQRKREVWSKPNPYIIPLWEKTEIEQKIKELDRLIRFPISLDKQKVLCSSK